MAIVASWSKLDLDLHIRRVWKRVAYMTRYGHISLEEAVSLDLPSISSYLDALSEIVSEENKGKGA